MSVQLDLQPVREYFAVSLEHPLAFEFELAADEDTSAVRLEFVFAVPFVSHFEASKFAAAVVHACYY